MGSPFKNISPREFMTSIVGKSSCSFATVRFQVMQTNTKYLAFLIHFLAKTWSKL